jgi:probable HAF family extracellular repeat protein
VGCDLFVNEFGCSLRYIPGDCYMKAIVAVMFVVISFVIVVPTHAVIQYTCIDLGTLGGSASYAYDINESGQVVGSAYNSTSADQHAFLYSGATMTDLGTFGGTQSDARGINDAGQIVGSAFTSGNATEHIFLYSGSKMNDLGTLGGMYAFAGGINSTGQAVGQAINANGDWHAFLYDGSRMNDLGTLGGSQSYAHDINISGRIVGGAWTIRDAAVHAFSYSGSKMTDLGTLQGGNWSTAYSVNAGGQIAGTATIAGGSYRAFLYSGSTMANLGTLGGTASYAWGINDGGQVVGSAKTAGNAADHAFLFSGSTMIDLNSSIDPHSGWTLAEAHAINNAGQIVGFGTNALGKTHAFLLTPVPEPSTLALLVMGGIGLIAWGWRRKWATGVTAVIMAVLVTSNERAQADVFNMPLGQTSLEFVPVGDINNMSDPSTGRGAVTYAYDIGKFDITAGQYAQFLTAVASNGASYYGLSGFSGYPSGSSITYNSETHCWTADSPNQPVSKVSWGDALRFCNWLHNGQPTGALTGNPGYDAGLTEDGAYYLNGKTGHDAWMFSNHKPGATYWIPYEREWYKAAYYDPNKGGAGVGGYWYYPTKSDASNPPSNMLSTTGTNNANFYIQDVGFTVGWPMYTTPVGTFANSPSAYGTFDQGGNVYQWLDSPPNDVHREVRGGAFADSISYLASNCVYSATYGYGSTGADAKIGFRVVSLPSSVWATNTDGNWLTPSNWIGRIVPSGPGTTAHFTGANPALVNVDSLVAVGRIILDAGTEDTNYTISGSAITLDNTGGTGTDALIEVVSGNHTISAPVILAEVTTISGSGTLNLLGGVTGNFRLTVLTSASASSVQVDSLVIGRAGSLQAVPEPSTIALLLTASIGGLLWWRRRR